MRNSWAAVFQPMARTCFVGPRQNMTANDALRARTAQIRVLGPSPWAESRYTAPLRRASLPPELLNEDPRRVTTPNR